jgi:hypothetical protein
MAIEVTAVCRKCSCTRRWLLPEYERLNGTCHFCEDGATPKAISPLYAWILLAGWAWWVLSRSTTLTP